MKKVLLFTLVVLLSTLAARADVTINATNFPDANFRSYLMSEYPSGTITTAQLNARTELILENKGISDMTGVQYFTQLTKLSLYYNNLTSFDASPLTKLKYLNLGYNKLTSVIVNNNTALEQLYLQNNQLTVLTVYQKSALRTLWIRNNPNLTKLYCAHNNITNLDIYNCTALEDLKCFYNSSLNVIQGLETCTALTLINCEDCAITSLNVTNLVNLENLLAARNQLTTLDAVGLSKLLNINVRGNDWLTELNCSSCDLVQLIVGGCTALNKLWCYYNDELRAITGLADCTALTYLDCEDCAITELPGVNNMTNLQRLWARNNQLTGSLNVSNLSQLNNLRVSGNTSLTSLSCNQCNLTSLDVSGCTALTYLSATSNRNLTAITGLRDCNRLTYLGCNDCKLGSIDVSGFTALSHIDCYNQRENALTSINVTGCTALKDLIAFFNNSLTTITGLGGCTAMASIDCDGTGVSSFDVSNMPNLVSLNCGSTPIVSLEVTGKSHFYHLGVSHCNNLESLTCNNNGLTELSVKNCPALSFLNCNYNQLTDLDLSGCTGLRYVWCRSNQLTSLDLSPCNSNNLLSIDCSYNQISSLDVGRFTNLFQLACNSNQISSLQLANHTQLKNLWCGMNNLTSLDLSGCTSLETVDAIDNQIASMNVSNCPNLNSLTIYYNHLTGTAMGNLIASLPTRSGETGNVYAIVDRYPDSGSTDEGNVITPAQVSQANAKNWAIYHYNWYNNSWEPIAGSSFQRGDVNGDGQVKIGDVTTLINYLLSGDASGINLQAADCDQNGQVKIGDVTALINYLLSGTWPNKVTVMKAKQLTIKKKDSHPSDLLDLKTSELKAPVMRGDIQ